jgi:N-acetylmuramoyl-L-alanine amidase
MRSTLRWLMWMAITMAFAFTPAFAASLTEPRIGKSPGVSRVVLDLPEGATYSLEPLGVAMTGFTLENGGGNAIMTLVTPQGVSSRSGYRESVLSAAQGKTGSRLVLDFSGAYADITPLQPKGMFAFQKAIGTRFTAVIDPGHGGKDPGARGVLTEEPLNLDVAKRVTALLQAAGVDVLLTRTNSGTLVDDKALDLASRAAQSRGKSVYVSIHANARPPRNANNNFGTEVYYYSPDKVPNLFPPAIVPEPLRSLESLPVNAITGGLEKLGEALQVLDGVTKPPMPTPPGQVPVEPSPSRDEAGFSSPTLGTAMDGIEPDLSYLPLEPTKMANSPERAAASQQLAFNVLSSVLGSAASFNGGARNADYFVIKESECPAILVEMGYVTHPVEGQQLKDSNYLDRIAYGISYGVLEYLENSANGI